MKWINLVLLSWRGGGVQTLKFRLFIATLLVSKRNLRECEWYYHIITMKALSCPRVFIKQEVKILPSIEGSSNLARGI